MEKFLNRGLNFAIMSRNLDFTQVLADFKYFERNMIWHEFWYGRDNTNEYKKPIFKKKKSNLPKNYKIPEALKTFLNSVRSELMDPKNRNKVSCNITPAEIKALVELIKLQKEQKIVIKKCDKGAGIIILDYQAYIEACNNHLNSKTENGESYYTKVNKSTITETNKEINILIEEAYDNDIITKDELEAINPEQKVPGKFYCNFKVHKDHTEGQPPPVRPIVSCCESLTENASLFVEHHLKNIAKEHDSYLQDTPDFLRHIEKLNRQGRLPPNTILVVIDVVGLFTNIPQNEGAECVRESLKNRTDSNVTTEFLIRLLKIILEYNIFEFNGELYRQLIGTAMGIHPAPSYANIFMSKIDAEIRNLAEKYKKDGQFNLKFLKRFLDDLFMVFTGSTKKLHNFVNEINTIHPNIKFTMSHTTVQNVEQDVNNQCSCEKKTSIPYLDTSCSIKEGQIILDLHRKPTDRNQYLLTSSCHPATCVENIPYSLALRITRICTENDTREKRYSELKELLMNREYNERIIDAAINKARKIPRLEAIQHKPPQPTNRRPVFVVPYDPRLPPLTSITKKHWRSMRNQDPYLAEVFPEPPLIAYKRQKNIKDYMIRAKVAPQTSGRPKRLVTGMKNCGKQCAACPFINKRKFISNKNMKWKLNKQMDCNTSNIVYMIECNKCNERYIGETKRKLKERLDEHRKYVRNDVQNATGEHFNKPGHSESNMNITAIEKVKVNDPNYRKEREQFYIRLFNTFYNGLNRSPK